MGENLGGRSEFREPDLPTKSPEKARNRDLGKYPGDPREGRKDLCGLRNSRALQVQGGMALIVSPLAHGKKSASAVS
jgi:hypothetical protein